MARGPLTYLADLAREVGDSVHARRVAAARRAQAELEQGTERDGSAGHGRVDDPTPRAERQAARDPDELKRRLDATRERLRQDIPPPD